MGGANVRRWGVGSPERWVYRRLQTCGHSRRGVGSPERWVHRRLHTCGHSRRGSRSIHHGSRTGWPPWAALASAAKITSKVFLASLKLVSGMSSPRSRASKKAWNWAW